MHSDTIERDDAIEAIMASDIEILDPDEVEEDPYVEPTGEGLTQRECRRLLIDEMNGRVNEKNLIRMRKYSRKARKFQATGKGEPPRMPILIKGYSRKRLNLAVCSARRAGILKELLANAGF